MILSHVVPSDERNPIYKRLRDSNTRRQYQFLESMVHVCLEVKRPMVSTTFIKALNYHAIACLQVYAGEYRPCPLGEGKGYVPPEHWFVPELMNSFVNTVNHCWSDLDTPTLAAYSLWQLNFIHPFFNGNGRTSRALCHFIVCMKAGGWLHGKPILPDLIVEEHEEYVSLLKETDAAWSACRDDYLVGLSNFLFRLIQKQVLGK